MKKLLVILLSIFTISAVSAQAIAEGDSYPKVGSLAPDFTVTVIDGSDLKLSDLAGKVVLVNFWATWCPPCRAELKRVQTEIVDKYVGDKFEFIAISVGEDMETIMKFREENVYKFAMGMDKDKEIFSKYAKSGIPRNFLIGRDGKILEVVIGYSPEIFEELDNKIIEALK